MTDMVPMAGIAAEELLRVTAAVEQQSLHPLARATTSVASARGMTLPVAAELTAILGRGIRSSVDGEAVHLGRLLMFEEDADSGAPIPWPIREAVARLQAAGRTAMVVRHGAEWLGVIGLADEPRADCARRWTGYAQSACSAW